MLAARPDTRHTDAAALTELVLGDDTRIVRPAALSGQGTGELIGALLGDGAEPAFVEACRAATGGNPFLLSELLRSLADAGVAPEAAAAGQVTETTPETVARAVRARLGALSPTAGALARALVILGGEEDVVLTAELAGLERGDARSAADELRAASILAPAEQPGAGPPPLAFLHPLVSSAVSAEIGWAEQSEGHRRAAALLAERGAPAERRAVHLLACDPEGDAEVARTLIEASREVRARGAADAAARFAERALRERPPPELAAEALAARGVAELHAGSWGESVASLEAALASELDPLEGAFATIALADARLGAGAGEEEVGRSVPELRAALELVGGDDPRLTFLLESVLWSISQARLALIPAVGPPPHTLDDLAAATVLDPLQRLSLARWGMLMAGIGTVDQALDLCRRALGDGDLLRAAGSATASYYIAPSSLWLLDDLDAGIAVLDGMAAEVGSTGSPAAMTSVAHLRAAANLRAGRLDRVEEEAEAAGLTNEPWGVRLARFCLAEARAERGDHEGAQRALDEAMDATVDPLITGFGPFAAEIRGRVALAAGRAEAALADFEAIGAMETRFLIANPFLSTWRSSSALALRALGRDAEARERADEAVEQARRFGASRALGRSLRALGLVRGELEPLREAVAVLDTSQARLERAHALVAYGEALRRDGQRTEARGPLRDGLTSATECGATALAARAREELGLAGGRSPHRRPEERDELTPSERRVTALAGDGASTARSRASSSSPRRRSRRTSPTRTASSASTAAPSSRAC